MVRVEQPGAGAGPNTRNYASPPMSAPALARPDGLRLQIRGTSYPVLLPSIRDPRLHLASVIISLHVLGQVAFGFDLSIAQILIALGTAGLLEFTITFARDRVIMWPASALLTGNGVAFILRVNGTQHGDWWSLHGWWVFSGTAAIALLSKYVIRFRGRHVFNPSNFGLVVCFLAIGPEIAEPLDFWWGPLDLWMALALAIIVGGGLAILRRLRLLEIAVLFWVTFAGAIGILAATGHMMTARWHLGPIIDWHFWRVVVFSPEILIFLFFMITDPKTIPSGKLGRRAYAVSVALLAALLIAPFTTEFRSKVAVLGALTIVCVAWPLVQPVNQWVQGWVGEHRPRLRAASSLRPVRATVVLVLMFSVAVSIGFAGMSARFHPSQASEAAIRNPESLPAITIGESNGVSSQLDKTTSQQVAQDLIEDLAVSGRSLWVRDTKLAAEGATGQWLGSLLRRIGAPSTSAVVLSEYDLNTLRVRLEVGKRQGAPTVVADLAGEVRQSPFRGSPPRVFDQGELQPFTQTLELTKREGRWLIVRSRSASPVSLAMDDAPATAQGSNAGAQLADVAKSVGLNFQQDAFHYGVSADPPAMMGGGVCWFDYDGDGWLDVYAVNSYADSNIPNWQESGGLPRNALFHNEKGHFVDVSKGSGADLQMRGNGCVAADLDGDGRTDLYVTSVGTDALLWNDGGGHFTEDAEAAGITGFGWHAGAAVGDVNGDGLPDLFIAGYTDMNAPIATSSAGFPSNHRAVADRLYLNLGAEGGGRPTFRDVAKAAGIEPKLDHGLGASFTDANADGRLDLYVANDEDPNRLYLNQPGDTPLGFHFVDAAVAGGVADPNAGMGIASMDFTGDARADLIVTNARGQLHATYRATRKPGVFEDALPDFVQAYDTRLTGWGVSWADLDLDGIPELVIANGGIPVHNLRRDAQRIQVIGADGKTGAYVDASKAFGLHPGPLVNGRGLAQADFDNDGDPDLAVGSIGGKLVLLRNGGTHGHWLGVAPSPLEAGTTVTFTLEDGSTVVREVHLGSSYLSSEDPRLIVGLGKSTTVRKVVVRFPGGVERQLEDVPANAVVKVEK
jgi:ASPIC and UnbV/FG-GAP-like repeat/NQR2, RnfD, RnfE family